MQYTPVYPNIFTAHCYLSVFSACLGENGVLWVSSAVNFPVVCSCLRVALACTPKLERHHAERALRRSRDLLGQEPTSPSLRAPNDMGKSAPKRASDADQDERPAEAKAGSGQEPPPSGAGGGTDGAPAAPLAPVDSAEELRVLRKRLEQLEAQAARPVAQPDGGDPPPGGGGGGGDGGGAGGKAAKDRERVRPDPPTPPDSDADSSEDDVGGGGHRAPPRLGGGVGRDDAVGELFGGHKLACDYDSDNPFERKRGLQLRTSHYAPAAAGDTVHAELHRKLGAANQREVCTLLPSLSYIYDLHTCTIDTTKNANSCVFYPVCARWQHISFAHPLGDVGEVTRSRRRQSFGIVW